MDFSWILGIRRFQKLHIATCDFDDIRDRICRSDIANRESGNLQQKLTFNNTGSKPSHDGRVVARSLHDRKVESLNLRWV